jgi:hypothetical protein
MKPKPTLQRVSDLLSYDGGTGIFQWRGQRRGPKKPDNTAGTIHVRGYRQIRIDGHLYMAHQLAWLVVHGCWPEKLVDHKNRNKADNRIDNLRLATNSQNKANCAAYRGSKSGIKGVAVTNSGRYLARIKINDAPVHLGTFDTAEAATDAFNEAHKSVHGEFSH